MTSVCAREGDADFEERRGGTSQLRTAVLEGDGGAEWEAAAGTAMQRHRCGGHSGRTTEGGECDVRGQVIQAEGAGCDQHDVEGETGGSAGMAGGHSAARGTRADHPR